MWFLEHESLFEGKRVWLRPGSQHLFGRTKGSKSDGNVFIDHKTVSRQHMMLKVLEVLPEDGTKLHKRSQLEITDLSGRQGTIIDGTRTLMSKKEGKDITSYDKVILSGTQHTIRLTASYPDFYIKWQPIVFTYASKESKGLSAKLHAFDVKTSSDFVYDQTTHVITQKRNLPKVLQGLVAATHIVTPEYLEAVVKVAIPQNMDPENYRASKLEEDFDTWWPKEKEYIPPVAGEPVPRPEQMLEPDLRRSEVFSGLTFVFLKEDQYNSLHEPIAGGGGKALLFHVDFGKTTVKEYVEFVRNVAGLKRGAKASNGRLPVVTIRLSGFPEGMEEWATNFVTGVDQTLNQRSIQQNEFLDAIVTNDVSPLQKPPPETEMTASVPVADTSANNMATRASSRAPSQAPESTPAPDEKPAKVIPRKRRGITQSRFTGFDDYEPPTKARKIEQDMPMEDIPESMPTQRSQRTQRAFKASQGPYVQTSQVPSGSATTTQRSRRNHSPIEETIEEMDQDELFPAAAALKKRRAATRGVSASVEPDTPSEAHKPKGKGAEVLERLQKAKKKASKDIDVREQTRLRMKEEEEKRKADEDALAEQLEGVDISQVRNNIAIEEMEVIHRQNKPKQRSNATDDGRWNPEWNGRKNFKKFRRRGMERGPQAPKVLVSLEEAPQKKGFGLGDAFFLEEPSQPKISKRRKARTQEDSASEQEPGFTRPSGRRTQNKDQEVINVEDSEPNDEDVVVPATASSRGNRTQRVAETQVTASQSQNQTQRGAKRRAPISVTGGQPPPGKRSRVTRRNDSSDEEETGFRFRRRG